MIEQLTIPSNANNDLFIVYLNKENNAAGLALTRQQSIAVFMGLASQLDIDVDVPSEFVEDKPKKDKPKKGCPMPSHHPSCDCNGMGGDR